MGVVDGYVAAFTPLRHDQNRADSLTVLALSLVAWNGQGSLCESGIVAPSPLDRDSRMTRQRASDSGTPRDNRPLQYRARNFRSRSRSRSGDEGGSTRVEVDLDLCRGKLCTGFCTPVLAAANAAAAAAAAKSATCLLVYSTDDRGFSRG
jgi:hypothetical protein